MDSDKFSTYAILYEDTEKGSGPHVHDCHPCERGHIFSYHVFKEPTTETDGYAGWVCDRCGIFDPDHADFTGPAGYIILSAHPDVTLSISFAYEEEEYVLTVKGDNPKIAEYLATGDLFYGFIYLGDGFGLEKAAEVPKP
ncbi:MAG: hypothetical protein K6A72_07415 [Lachnospiraceae bacterium]|nr:hypothetical protein [Lachnospiraceae bacterium]